MLYQSITNPKIKELKKLHTKKYRDLLGLFLVEGEHLVYEAYQKGVLKEVILLEGMDHSFSVPAFSVTSSVMTYLSQLESIPPMMGVCQKETEPELVGNHILILDQVQDPGNLGTILRSSVAFHIDLVLLSENTVDLYNSKVIRASQGMLFHQNIKKVDLLPTLEILRKQGYSILGTKVTGGKSLKSVVKMKKFAIIVGNEGQGVRNSVTEACDSYLYIDMNPACESLNVAVAASILLYELDK